MKKLFLKITKGIILFFTYAPIYTWAGIMVWTFITQVLLKNTNLHWLLAIACFFAILYAALFKTPKTDKENEEVID